MHDINAEIDNLQAGSLLQGGKYQIVRFVNSGGFGCTYEALFVTMHNTRVAIKEFFVKDFCRRDNATGNVCLAMESKRELVDMLKRKFFDEAQKLFNMHHEGIVRVTDVFLENNTAYYVMDFIDGRSIGDILKREGTLPESRALHYIGQVCDALTYLHSHNCLHLDIKPGNIMVDKNGNAILIDFGTAKQYDEVNGENTSALTGKTPGYAPLEQTGNNVVTFTPPTDIYALGATLYKMLTGKTPPPANLLASGERELEPLPEGISHSTSAAISAAMRSKKGERPQTVSEFKKMLYTTVTDDVTQIDGDEQPSTPNDGKRGNKRKIVAIIMIAALAIMMMAGAYIAYHNATIRYNIDATIKIWTGKRHYVAPSKAKATTTMEQTDSTTSTSPIAPSTESTVSPTGSEGETTPPTTEQKGESQTSENPANERSGDIYVASPSELDNVRR